jgi:ATP/maltotriose-dependent transcriptional regulator MalT
MDPFKEQRFLAGFYCDNPNHHYKTFYLFPRTHQDSRPRSRAPLQREITSQLTLLPAPAGYGKTALLSEWIGQWDIPFSWLSLDHHDYDLKRFLVYIITGLQSIPIEGDEQILNLYPSHL